MNLYELIPQNVSTVEYILHGIVLVTLLLL
jgi:hypothetical protein